MTHLKIEEGKENFVPDFSANYPNGTPQPMEKWFSDAENSPKISLHLGEAIALNSIQAGEAYLLMDTDGRILCANNGGEGTSWQWAYMGKYTDYPKDVMAVIFSNNPAIATSNMSINVSGTPLTLKANGNSSNWEYLFWGSNSYGGYPTLNVRALDVGGGRFALYYNTSMVFCGNGGSWNWAFIGNSQSYDSSKISFAAYKFYITRTDILTLLKANWPSVNFDFCSFRNNDDKYELIDESKAKSIWSSSGLSTYKWTENVFDCDDFSYVYKAEASKQAYKDAVKNSYAVGIIIARTPNAAHAANIIINFRGEVKILEPQNGQITSPSQWKDRQGVQYQPYFILF